MLACGRKFYWYTDNQKNQIFIMLALLPITPKRVRSGGVHLRGLAPGQHSFKCRRGCKFIDDAMSDLTDPGIEDLPHR